MNDLSWSNIRAREGSQQAGFEEICAQLARSETPKGAKFVRKGSPDAGVECFCVLEDGSEWGWQAKFFTSSPGSSQWKQLDKSVQKALDKHPRLSRYFVCMPIDPPDARRGNEKSMLDKWPEDRLIEGPSAANVGARSTRNVGAIRAPSPATGAFRAAESTPYRRMPDRSVGPR